MYPPELVCVRSSFFVHDLLCVNHCFQRKTSHPRLLARGPPLVRNNVRPLHARQRRGALHVERKVLVFVSTDSVSCILVCLELARVFFDIPVVRISATSCRRYYSPSFFECLSVCLLTMAIKTLPPTRGEIKREACVTQKMLRLTPHKRTSRASCRTRGHLLHCLGSAKRTACVFQPPSNHRAGGNSPTICRNNGRHNGEKHPPPPRAALSKLDACCISITSLSPLSITSPLPSNPLLLLLPTTHPRERSLDCGDPIGKPCIPGHEGFVQSLAFLSFFGPGGRFLQPLDFVPGGQRDVLGRGEAYRRVRG